MFDFDDLEEEEEDPTPDLEALARKARDEAQRAADSLSDPAWNVRRKACKELGELGEAARPFLPALKRLVETDDDFEVQKAARSALKELRSVGICIEKRLANAARQELARDSVLDRPGDAEQFGGSSSSTAQPEKLLEIDLAKDKIPSSSEEVTYVPTKFASCSEQQEIEAKQVPMNAGVAVWTHADIGQSSEVSFPYENCTVLEDVQSSSDREDIGRTTNYLEKKLPMRDSLKIRMPDAVSWTGFRVNFQINLEVLPMRMERESMLPIEVADIWENHWGLQYVKRLKFHAQPDCEQKYLNPREDCLSYDPAIVKLEGAAGILCSLATALKTYGGLLLDEVQLARQRKAVELVNNPPQKSIAPQTKALPGSAYIIDRSKDGLQAKIDMDSRDTQRRLERRFDSSSLVRGVPRKAHSFGIYAVPDFRSAR